MIRDGCETQCFTGKVDTGMGFDLNLEHPEEMNPEIAMKLLNGIKLNL